MPITVVYETAETVTRDGVQQFKLNGICTNKGKLDDTYLFLTTIVENDDPTDDVFKRLCTIADFFEYKTDRDAAVQAGDAYFRSTNFTVFFDDVDVAAAAKTALNDRLDTLATDYATYLANFEDTGADYEFPTGTITALTALIEAYYDAWKAHDTVSRVSTEANTNVSRLDAAYVAAQTRLNVLYEWGNPTEDKLQHLYDEMNAASGALDTIVPVALAAADAMTAFITEFNKNSHPMGLYGKLYFNLAFQNETTAINDDTANDVELLPPGGTPPDVDDGFFFGGDVKFNKINLNIGQSGDGDWTLRWEYWNGDSWIALSVVDGSQGYEAPVGWHEITFDVPSDWAKTKIPSAIGTFAFWVRGVLDTYVAMITQPLASRAYIYPADSEEGASALSHNNLDGDLDDLVNARDALLVDREMVILAVAAAGSGVTNHDTQHVAMDALISAYTIDKTTAQDALSQATADKLIANRDAAEKLLLLTVAYEAVRAVQSDWVPDAWFPYPGP